MIWSGHPQRVVMIIPIRLAPLKTQRSDTMTFALMNEAIGYGRLRRTTHVLLVVRRSNLGTIALYRR